MPSPFYTLPPVTVPPLPEFLTEFTADLVRAMRASLGKRDFHAACDEQYVLADMERFDNNFAFKEFKVETFDAGSDLPSRAAARLFNNLDWNHLALVIFILIAAVLCLILSGLSQFLSRSIVQDAEKRSTYECGFSPHDSATRAPFDVHYYITGIMFLVFDVEIALIFPFASSAYELEWLAYANMAIFIVILTIGFAYEWVRGALLWSVKLLNGVPANWNLNNSQW
jgi:NADH-quinone oxidoreductase subunit A